MPSVPSETGPLGYMLTMERSLGHNCGTHGDRPNITHALQALRTGVYASLCSTVHDLLAPWLQ